MELSERVDPERIERLTASRDRFDREIVALKEQLGRTLSNHGYLHNEIRQRETARSAFQQELDEIDRLKEGA